MSTYLRGEMKKYTFLIMFVLMLGAAFIPSFARAESAVNPFYFDSDDDDFGHSRYSNSYYASRFHISNGRLFDVYAYLAPSAAKGQRKPGGGTPPPGSGFPNRSEEHTS